MAGLLDPNEVLTRNGKHLTRRVWALIDDVAVVTGVELRVIQGGFRLRDASGGASASSGTHDVGDVFDIDLVPSSKRDRVLLEFRRRGVVFYWRTPDTGWTKTGAHGHGVVRDSFYGLSRGARQQVDAYDRGRNGLANGAPDPWPALRPRWRAFRISRRARVTRYPSTWAYSIKSERGIKVQKRRFCPFPLPPNVEYVAVERDSIGRLWLKTPAGNWILAAATNYKP